MGSDNHPFEGISYHQHPGPTHFPFLGNRAVHFPDVPLAGSQMPIRHLSSNRRHLLLLLPIPSSGPPGNHPRAVNRPTPTKAFKPLRRMTHRGSSRGILPRIFTGVSSGVLRQYLWRWMRRVGSGTPPAARCRCRIYLDRSRFIRSPKN